MKKILPNESITEVFGYNPRRKFGAVVNNDASQTLYWSFSKEQYDPVADDFVPLDETNGMPLLAGASMSMYSENPDRELSKIALYIYNPSASSVEIRIEEIL